MSHGELESEIELGCRGNEAYQLANGAGNFPLPGDKPRYPRDRVADIKHVRLDIALDLDAKRISGSVSHTLAPINEGLASLELDAVELDISGVRLASGAPLNYSVAGGRLHIDLDNARHPGEDVTITVDFSGSPRRGLYFIQPDEAYPDKRKEAWTQGQDEDSRHWFPCYDYPNEMATSEMHVTVAEPYYAISNGELLSIDEAPGNARTYHWKQNSPHVAYLLSVVAGEYTELADDWDGIPLQYYVPPGREDDGREVFKNTPDILAFFSERTGVRYPYAKYSQVVVQDFIFGGMENVSATTLTENCLYDGRARIDIDADALIAHEAAHQWFGDLLTCRDWSHGWLNEGFATFMELAYAERNKGRDEFLYALRQEMDNYLGEAGRYRRPIVTNVYNEPIDLFDRHLYEKGGITLNMLRVVLGETMFWKAIRRYVISRRGASVVTMDLQRAIEEGTGRNLDWFFDQWVFSAGHPELKGQYAWDDASKTAKVSLKQEQKGTDVPELFRLPLRIAFKLDNGETENHTFEMTEKEQSFTLPLAAKPVFLRVDPEVLKTLDLDQPADMLRRQLAEDEHPLGRVEAARALSKKSDRDTVAALGKAAREDGFWGVQAEAAKALGAIKTIAAMEELLASTGVAHPKARRAIIRALGEFREERAADAIIRVIDEGDASYYVEAAAAGSVGKTRSPRAFDALHRALGRDSQNDIVRASVFEGFGELKDARAIDTSIEWSRYGKPGNVRGAAASALGKLHEVASDQRKEEIVDHLIGLLDDSWFRTQMSAISALQEIKAKKALGALERTASSALDGRTIRTARTAIKAIRDSGSKDEDLKKLREEVDKLTDENRTLKDRLDKIEARLGQQ